jgi:uncharacterized protein YceK
MVKLPFCHSASLQFMEKYNLKTTVYRGVSISYGHQDMKILLLLFATLLSGCSTILYNVNPPYVDSKLTNEYATIFSSWEKAQRVLIIHVDGAWAKRDKYGDIDHPTNIVYVKPGIRVVTLYCAVPSGFQQGTSWKFEISVNLNVGERYEISCAGGSDIELPKIQVTNNGVSVPINMLRTK